MVDIPLDISMERTDFDLAWQTSFVNGFLVKGETLYPLPFLNAEIFVWINLFRFCLL